MSRGKHLSLDEARRMKRLGQYAKETEYQKGDRAQFEETLAVMSGASASGKKRAKRRTSNKVASNASVSRDRFGRAGRRPGIVR